jgi:hypothetical protein
MALTVLVPYLILPSHLPEPPAIEEYISTEEIERIKAIDDAYKKEVIEQFVVSVCDIRKVDGKTDIFPSNTDLTNLTYSDTTYNLSLILGSDILKKSDGTLFTMENLSSETECDVSDFVH